MNYYGQIDLTKLDAIKKEHPEAIKYVQFKDGIHALLNIDVRDRMNSEKNEAYIKAYVKNPKEGVNLFVGDLLPSKFDGNQQATAPAQQAMPGAVPNAVPFTENTPIPEPAKPEQPEWGQLPF